MAERCSNCGAELFAGQQFCRRCGAAVGRAQEDAPTQIFPQAASSPGPSNSGPVNSGPFVRRGMVDVPKVPDIPIPADLGDRIKKAINDAGVPMPLDESGATVTGTDTVLTKTYAIDDDATFSIRGVGGNVTVTGTDGDQAELKITKHGGSPQEREAARVLLSKTDEQLSLVSAAPPGAVEISYEIKLPRELHQIEITSDRGGVKIEEFGGAVVVNLREGNLEFRDVTGDVHSKLVNGDTKVSLDTK